MPRRQEKARQPVNRPLNLERIQRAIGMPLEAIPADRSAPQESGNSSTHTDQIQALSHQSLVRAFDGGLAQSRTNFDTIYTPLKVVGHGAYPVVTTYRAPRQRAYFGADINQNRGPTYRTCNLPGVYTSRVYPLASYVMAEALPQKGRTLAATLGNIHQLTGNSITPTEQDRERLMDICVGAFAMTQGVAIQPDVPITRLQPGRDFFAGSYVYALSAPTAPPVLAVVRPEHHFSYVTTYGAYNGPSNFVDLEAGFRTGLHDYLETTENGLVIHALGLLQPGHREAVSRVIAAGLLSPYLPQPGNQ